MIFGILRLLLLIVLVLVFGYAGTNKLTNALDADMHQKMVEGSQRWAPLINKKIVQKIAPDLSFSAEQQRQAIGAAEVAAAAAMLFGGFLGTVANICLIGLMAGAFWLHTQLAEPTVAPLTLGGLLFLLIVLGKLASPSKAQKKAKRS